MSIYTKSSYFASHICENANLNEGGNLIVDGENGPQQATKILTKEMGKDLFEELKQDLKDFLVIIDADFEKTAHIQFWPDMSLIDNGSIFSGSTRTFFTKPWEQYSQFKPAVGDLDVQIPGEAKELGFFEFLEKNQGKQIGNFILYGSKQRKEYDDQERAKRKEDKITQEHSLITWIKGYEEFGCQYIQVDWEYTEFDNSKPTEWSSMSHYSSWEDIQNNVKGAFSKILIKSAFHEVSDKRNAQFYSAKTGKPVKAPTAGRSMYDFNVDRGVITRMDYTKDGVSKRATSEYSYTKNPSMVYEILFGKKPENDSDKKVVYSFVRLVKKMVSEYSQEMLERVFAKFINDIWEENKQQLDRDIEGDEAVKNAAVEKFLELAPTLNTPETRKAVEDMKKEYHDSDNRKPGANWAQRHSSATHFRVPHSESFLRNHSSLYEGGYSSHGDPTECASCHRPGKANKPLQDFMDKYDVEDQKGFCKYFGAKATEIVCKQCFDDMLEEWEETRGY